MLSASVKSWRAKRVVLWRVYTCVYLAEHASEPLFFLKGMPRCAFGMETFFQTQSTIPLSTQHSEMPGPQDPGSHIKTSNVSVSATRGHKGICFFNV